MRLVYLYLLWPVATGLFLLGCQSTTAPASILPTQATEAALATLALPTGPPPHTPTRPPTNTPTHSPTPLPTATATASPTPTAIPSPTLSPTPIGPCNQRVPEDDLLTIVTQTYGLSRDYEPADLVPLSESLPVTVTLGYPTEVRRIAVQPVVQLVNDMLAAGLHPTVNSGYRSYAAQVIAWDKWLSKQPETAAVFSARPGHSEHQLGTTVDFGSPELSEIVGSEDVEFHTYFYKSSEGIWLDENAHHYGFTLSYPREAFELTGFYYEPWHYRYVGVEMATMLKEIDTFLTEYQLRTQPEPCIP